MPSYPKQFTYCDITYGGCSTGTAATEFSLDARSGVSRPKPPGDFIPPTAYYREIEEGYPYGLPYTHGFVRMFNNRFKYWFHYTFDGSWRSYYGNRPAKPSCPEEIIQGSRNKALSHMKQQRVNFAVAFGERRQVISMVAKNIHRIRRGITHVKRGDVPRALKEFRAKPKKAFKHTTKDAASLWLELQYGWKPLLSDVYGAVDLLNEKDGFDPSRYTCSFTGKFSDHIGPFVANRSDVLAGPLGMYKVHHSIGDAIFYKAKTRVDAMLTHPNLGLAGSLGLTNPLDVAWELVPFSFVVDWFLPVGRYLNLLDATSGYTFRSGSTTHTGEHLRNIDFLYLQNTSSSTFTQRSHQFETASSAYRRFYIQRTVLGDFPEAADLRFSKDPLGGLRVYNALALLRQIF